MGAWSEMMDVNDPGYQLIKKELFRHLKVNSDAYKDTYLMRRIKARMRKLGIGSCMEYYHIIKMNKQELDELLLTIAINVTEFFRDPIVWETFKKKSFQNLSVIRKSITHTPSRYGAPLAPQVKSPIQ